MHLIPILLLMFPLASFAHGPDDPTDWRNDHAAYRSARVEDRLKLSKSAIGEYPDLPISPDYLKTKLSEFTGAVPVRIDGKEVRIEERGGNTNLDLARRYLQLEYEALGFKVSFHSFSSGKNLIAEKMGTDPARPTLILSSHIDSVGNAGANDDGVGTIAALAIAQALSKIEYPRTIRVVGFDREERGLVGSSAYVKSLPANQKILGNIQMEMMAVDKDKDGKFHVIDCGKGSSAAITKEIMSAVTALQLPLTRVSACTSASDHASFWAANHAAVVLSENFFGGDSDPCYHRACDVVDSRIDFTYVSQIARATASAAAKMMSGAWTPSN